MSSLTERAGGLVEGWPPGGLVVGLLPDPSDPRWAGRAALAIARAVADRRQPALILDLAPKDTDLASRFDAADQTGFAELVAGEVRLWEIIHRHAVGEAFYVPCGLRTPGAELARSPAARTLADRVRDAGRILLVPLDRRGAGEAASAGWVDGFVRIGDRSVSSARLSGGAQALGHLERPDEDPEAGEAKGATEESPGPFRGQESGKRDEVASRSRGRRPGTSTSRRDRPPRERSAAGARSRMRLPRRRRRSGGVLRTAVRAILAAALVLAAGLTVSAWLGGPGWQELREAAGTVAGEVGGEMPPAAGPASDSTASDRREGIPTATGDSASLSVPPSAESGDTLSR